MEETLTCAWCGKTFRRAHPRGPLPRYCGAAHRQRAHEAREKKRFLATGLDFGSVAALMAESQKAAMGSNMGGIAKMVADIAEHQEIAVNPTVGIAKMVADISESQKAAMGSNMGGIAKMVADIAEHQKIAFSAAGIFAGEAGKREFVPVYRRVAMQLADLATPSTDLSALASSLIDWRQALPGIAVLAGDVLNVEESQQSDEFADLVDRIRKADGVEAGTSPTPTVPSEGVEDIDADVRLRVVAAVLVAAVVLAGTLSETIRAEGLGLLNTAGFLLALANGVETAHPSLGGAMFLLGIYGVLAMLPLVRSDDKG